MPKQKNVKVLWLHVGRLYLQAFVNPLARTPVRPRDLSVVSLSDQPFGFLAFVGSGPGHDQDYIYFDPGISPAFIKLECQLGVEYIDLLKSPLSDCVASPSKDRFSYGAAYYGCRVGPIAQETDILEYFRETFLYYNIIWYDIILYYIILHYIILYYIILYYIILYYIISLNYITKTCLFKYIENFTTKKMKIFR